MCYACAKKNDRAGLNGWLMDSNQIEHSLHCDGKNSIFHSKENFPSLSISHTQNIEVSFYLTFEHYLTVNITGAVTMICKNYLVR